MAITLSHGGDTIFSSKSRSDEVLVGTKDGLAFLKRNGDGWTETHRALPDKHIHAVIVEPESGAILVGATHDTVYVSEDGGQTWERSGRWHYPARRLQPRCQTRQWQGATLRRHPAGPPVL